MSNYGNVVLLGAGPGEIGLLTLKGLECIKKADCIIYDRLLNKDILAFAPDVSEKIFVGKENHFHTMTQDKINELLFEKAKEYNLVVRLKGGDPYVFGRGGEEALYLKERGVKVEVVPGISSSIAALSAAGIPITHRGLSKGFQVITAHSKKDQLADIDYTQLIDESVTYVFLMGLSHVGEIAAGLMAAGRSADTKAAVVSSGTTNHQKKVLGTLSDIDAKVKVAGIQSLAIIVVGDVVSLSDELNFFEERPLFGKKYFLPIIKSFNYSLVGFEEKSRINELEKSLISKGAEIVTVTAGTIVPTKCDLSFLDSLSEDSCIVFTSGNGVKAFFWNLYEVAGLDGRVLGKARFAAIGQKTAEVLRNFGYRADFISKKQNGEDLAVLLNEKLEAGTSIYWLCQKSSSEYFEGNISVQFNLNKIYCYENVESDIEVTDSFLSEVGSCDGAIFTSGSNASFAINLLGAHLPKAIYSIGPACSKRIETYGFSVTSEAKISSYEGVIKCIKNTVVV